ncbi:hypothetical protein [Nocardia cyriacigeorgica]|uniref:hypothetical protein n=1 Tax=Nocardia cyriacigeorgica TaxID=135487 RepID=UPI0018934965|nr:hypothetical protein [Nocardia cyriacigeorgica]MBF6325864.1 hypothetical protein [Nocardia cyriacigeorgica]
MQGSKWPDDIRHAALTLMKQLHQQQPEMSRRAVCIEVSRQMDPAPALDTLLWWARAHAVFPGPPRLQAGRHSDQADAADEPQRIQPADVDALAAVAAASSAADNSVFSLQEMTFNLRMELRNFLEQVTADDVETLRAADEHLLTVETLLRSLNERIRETPQIPGAVGP